MKRVISSSIFVALITTIFMGCSTFSKETSNNELNQPASNEKDSFAAHPLNDVANNEPLLPKDNKLIITVLGQGVAPKNSISPAQAYGLAKRAAIADGYRLIAEKVKGVRVEGDDLIQNMMVKRSTIRTTVDTMIKNANVTESTFKDGLCEVEMEIVILHSQFAQ